MVMSIVFGVLGIGLIIFGIKILLTGTLTKSEEAKIASYSKKGARTYKLINVVMYIVTGLFLIGECRYVYRCRSLFDRRMYCRFSRIPKNHKR